MTSFRPKSLSPEALEAWDIAEANIEASLQKIKELAAPLRHSDTAPLLWVLYNHQGAYSQIGQPIRQYLGIGQFESMTADQIQAAKQYRDLIPEVVPPSNCRQRLKSEGKPYPKSSCEVCGSILSPNRMWQECDAALAMEVSQQSKPSTGSLVERVLQKVLDTPSPVPLSMSPNQIRAAILEVAAWLRVESEGHFGNGLHWSKRLEQEAAASALAPRSAAKFAVQMVTEPLSPAAQAVLDVAMGVADTAHDAKAVAAAALRTAVAQVVPEQLREPHGTGFRWGGWAAEQGVRDRLLAIAAELEGILE